MNIHLSKSWQIQKTHIYVSTTILHNIFSISLYHLSFIPFHPIINITSKASMLLTDILDGRGQWGFRMNNNCAGERKHVFKHFVYLSPLLYQNSFFKFCFYIWPTIHFSSVGPKGSEFNQTAMMSLYICNKVVFLALCISILSMSKHHAHHNTACA